MKKPEEDRGAVLDDIRQQLADGTLSFGGAIRQLRLRVTGLNQTDFARMCKLSLRTLRQLEQDAGNPTVATLDSVLRLFGMRVGVVAVKRREVGGTE
ncbi:helix-turn-helix domain-containing protein [Azotobacter bryophylli]|uniref:Helix-turn-helix domain-containing protein n=1 Tax=Azotobacter bryophylli TaxID=1986537 RepID=A0ABV7AQZ6_9GAMM